MESNHRTPAAHAIRPAAPACTVTPMNSPDPSAVTVPTTPEQAQRIKRSERLLRMDLVEDRTALKKSAIYAMIRRGEFPAPVRISARAVAWRESQVDAWIENVINTAASASQKPAQRSLLPGADTQTGGTV